MIKEELIRQLQEKVPDGAEIVIFDHRKNLHGDDGDGSSVGIYSDFEIVGETLDKEQINQGYKQFASLVFDNDDYDEE